MLVVHWVGRKRHCYRELMMADERPSIEEILAMARAQDGGSGSPSKPPPSAEAVEAPAEEPAATDTAPAAPAKTPSSTADILAMARNQDAAGKGDSPAQTPAEPAQTEKPAAKPKAPAAKPSGTSDILAMARAQDAGGGDAVEEAAPPAEAAPAVESPATESDGERPSVQEMLELLRHTDGQGDGAVETDQPTVAATAVAPVEKPMPVRPAAPEAPIAPPAPVDRRSVLTTLLLLPAQLVATPFAVAWSALAAAAGAMTLGLARFMFPNTLVEPPMTFKIGPPSDYPPESVSTKFKADRAVWIVRSTMYNGQDQIVAISTVCTHLGCTPNWLEGEQKFKCPCHGSGFYKSGVNFEGPAPRPLERHGLKLAADGMLEVDKSKKFQEELGQWEEGSCFVNA